VKRALLVLAACGGAPKLPAAPTTSVKLPADIHDVVAIDEVGDATIVLDRERAFVIRGGALAASVPAPHGWRAGATIAAIDGEGAWAVGVSDDGRLYRITLAGELEDITDRFALTSVRAVAAAGTTTAFALPDGVAVSGDGIHELRAQLQAPAAVAASKGRVALAGAHSVDVWDLATRQQRTYPVTATSIAFVGGRLAVATGDAVLVEDGTQLKKLPIAGSQLAAAGTRLWIAGDALYALDGTTLRRSTAVLPRAAHLFASAGGDAFVATAGALNRISIDTGTDDPAWRAEVAPVFARVCAHCHMPGGDAGIDLSTEASWRADRDELVRRVLVTHTMPPAGTDLSPSDLDALRRWLSSTGR
jgi:mono/diheme cytochrome c family protein